MSTPPGEDRPSNETTPAEPEPESVPAEPETATQERVLDAFTDDQPRPTGLVVDRLDADEGTVRRALLYLEQEGVLERRQRDSRTTMWLPAERRDGTRGANGTGGVSDTGTRGGTGETRGGRDRFR